MLRWIVVCLMLIGLALISQQGCSATSPQHDSAFTELVTSLDGGEVGQLEESSPEPSMVADQAALDETRPNESTTEQCPESGEEHDFSEDFSQQCSSQKSYYAQVQCLTPYLHSLVQNESPKKAMCVLMDLYRSGAVADCHLLAHEIGKALFKKVKEPGVAIQQCPMDCIQGCIHGVMEDHILSVEKQQPNASDETLLSLCDSIPTNTLAFSQCVHGLGHGLFAHGRRSLAQAATLCESRKSASFQEDCLSGVFMENFDRYSTLDEAAMKAVLPTMCGSIRSNSRWLESCLASLGEGLAFYTSYNLDKGKALCQSLSPTYSSENVLACEFFLKTEIDASEQNRKHASSCP
ncbi:MAG: hypothetical protein EP343_08670 [Deltaproteobacteria bacterium]|nr:MAG: hypothetical protein EP343_08670 [Deltaproteobacteria bacterium]